jgi:hypothetical protein
VSEPLARLYDLALRTLDDQERRADALRGRLGPVLTAAALGMTLLSGPVLGGVHPVTVAGVAALVIAVGGLLLGTVAAFRLLGVRHRSLDALDPRRLATELAQSDQLEDEAAFYAAMIARLGMELDDRANTVERLATTFTAMLWGILVMLCGLAIAAIVG